MLFVFNLVNLVNPVKKFRNRSGTTAALAQCWALCAPMGAQTAAGPGRGAGTPGAERLTQG